MVWIIVFLVLALIAGGVAIWLALTASSRGATGMGSTGPTGHAGPTGPPGTGGMTGPTGPLSVPAQLLPGFTLFNGVMDSMYNDTYIVTVLNQQQLFLRPSSAYPTLMVGLGTGDWGGTGGQLAVVNISSHQRALVTTVNGDGTLPGLTGATGGGEQLVFTGTGMYRDTSGAPYYSWVNGGDKFILTLNGKTVTQTIL